MDTTSCKKSSLDLADRKESPRYTGSFKSTRDKKIYWSLLILFLIIGLGASIGLIFYNNPVAPSSPSFIPVVRRRLVALAAMVIATICHSFATVSFQTITNNRIITPSLLGFEALHTTIHTAIIFLFGARTFINIEGTGLFIMEIIVMVLASLILYGALLSGKFGNLDLMLLVGVILGLGLRSVSTFMRKLISPSEFDILQSKMYGSVNNANPAYLPLAIPIVLIVVFILYKNSSKLNLAALGPDVSTSLGANYKKTLTRTLILLSILMSITTALVGPMNFFGFLTASLSYQFTKSYDHKYIFSMAFAVGLMIITGAYFAMYNIVEAQGVVSILIELFGGGAFLILLLRKGKL